MNNKNKTIFSNHALLPLAAGTIAAVIWGFSFVFTKAVLNSTYPSQLLGLRFAAAAVTLTVLKITGAVKINLRVRDWLALIPLAFCQPVVYFLGETWGIKWTTASEAGIIIAFVPIFSAVAAGIFLKERIRNLQMAAIILSVIGVIIVVTAQGKIEFNEHLWGVLALFLAVIGAGIYSLLSRKSSANYSPVEITFVMMCVGALVFNILGVLEAFSAGNLGKYLTPFINTDVMIGIIYLGVLSSVLGFFLFNYALSRLKVSQSAPLINLTTVVSVLAGVFIQNDPFGLRHALGITLIILGVWGNNIFAAERKRNPEYGK